MPFPQIPRLPQVILAMSPTRLLPRRSSPARHTMRRLAAHDPSDYEGLNKLNEQLQAVTDESESLEMEWMELSEQLE